MPVPDIRIVMGVIVVLFACAAFFSSGDHSINILDKQQTTQAASDT